MVDLFSLVKTEQFNRTSAVKEFTVKLVSAETFKFRIVPRVEEEWLVQHQVQHQESPYYNYKPEDILTNAIRNSWVVEGVNLGLVESFVEDSSTIREVPVVKKTYRYWYYGRTVKWFCREVDDSPCTPQMVRIDAACIKKKED